MTTTNATATGFERLIEPIAPRPGTPNVFGGAVTVAGPVVLIAGAAGLGVAGFLIARWLR